MKEQFRFLYVGPKVLNNPIYGELIRAEEVGYHLRSEIPLNHFIELSSDEVEEYNELCDKFDELRAKDVGSSRDDIFKESGLKDFVDNIASKYGRK